MKNQALEDELNAAARNIVQCVDQFDVDIDRAVAALAAMLATLQDEQPGVVERQDFLRRLAAAADELDGARARDAVRELSRRG